MELEAINIILLPLRVNFMNKSFLDAVKKAKKQIESLNFMLKTRIKSTYFTRGGAKMSFADSMCFILKNSTKTMQIELDEFFNQNKESGISMTKQGFSQLREKINPGAFIDLNDNFINWFYGDGDFKRYRGFRLLCIDGSITEIPNTEKAREYFGYYSNQSERKLARAMVSVIYDAQNDLILESKICNWKTAERDVAKELINCLENKGFQKDLIIFDRGYPSKDFISFLDEKGLKYLIRIKRNKFSKQFDNANKDDQIIKIEYMGKTLYVRVINIVLQTGEIEKLITNVYDENFTIQGFKELYFKRWGVEVKYNQLKSRYELENFSGSNPIAVMQDFYSAIYLSNMMALAKSEANEKVKEEKKDLKYEYKVNMNILISKIRQILIKCLLTDDTIMRNKIFDQAMSSITKNLVPIRPNRSFPRKEPSRKNKYSLNRKCSM
jgi:hypothetical protein